MMEKDENKTVVVQEPIISEETSKRITALRFLLAILVLFIHNNYTLKTIADSVEQGSPNILFCPNAFSKWTQMIISQGIASSAVTLFYLFAAYLQARKADSYKVLLKKKCKGLLLPYVLWIGIYGFYFSFAKLIILKIAPSLVHTTDIPMLSWTAMDWIRKIFGYGTYNGVPEFAAHFWFVRDLFILVLISPILQFLIKKFKYGFLILAFVAYIFDVNIYFIHIEALFFYTCGLYWGYYNFDLMKIIDEIKYSEAIAIFLFCFLGEYIFFEEGGPMMHFKHISTCFIFLKLSLNIISKPKLYKVAAYLSGFSFFLYAIHMPLLNEFLKKAWIHFFPMKNGFFCLFEYFGVTALTIVIGTGIGIALKKICLPLFALLNGGRK